MTTHVHRALQWSGEQIAGLWLGLAGLVVIVGFQVCGAAVSLLLGGLIYRLVGGHGLGIVAGLIAAFGFGIFLAVYVWEPHVKPVMTRAADGLIDRKSS